jgi:hypothetical protein
MSIYFCLVKLQIKDAKTLKKAQISSLNVNLTLTEIEFFLTLKQNK